MSTKNETRAKSAAAKKAAPAASPKAKDLPTKKDAKGGLRLMNHNETLVRAPGC